MRRNKYFEKRRVALEALSKVVSTFPGDWESIFKGEGEEFYSLREYQPGDDPRKIHWPSLAKTGKPFVIEKIALRDRKVMVLRDFCSSMAFHLKPEIADIFSGMALSLALRNGNPAGFLGFSEKVEIEFLPRSGFDRLDFILEEMLNLEFQEGQRSDFKKAFNYVLEFLPRGSLVFLISDFQDENIFNKDFQVMANEYDLIPVIIRDPFEIKLPSLNQIVLKDLVTREIDIIQLTPERAREFERLMEENFQKLEERLYNFSLDFIELNSFDPDECFERIQEFFLRRKLGRRR